MEKEIQINDLVKIIDAGETYSTFYPMFHEMGFKNTTCNKSFETGTIGTVFDKKLHPYQNIMLYAVRDSHGNECLISGNGIEKIGLAHPTEENDFTLPEKWCIKSGDQSVVDYCNKNGVNKGSYSRLECENSYAHFPAYDGCTTRIYIAPGYTEITLEQFKKYVLKLNDMKEKIKMKVGGTYILKSVYSERPFKAKVLEITNTSIFLNDLDNDSTYRDSIEYYDGFGDFTRTKYKILEEISTPKPHDLTQELNDLYNEVIGENDLSQVIFQYELPVAFEKLIKDFLNSNK